MNFFNYVIYEHYEKKKTKYGALRNTSQYL